MMSTFLTLMVLAILCELIAAVTTFALNGEQSHQMGMRRKLKESLEMYGSPTSPDQTAAWDLIQTELHCCGLQDVNDYSSSNYTSQTGHLPVSCCGPLQLNKFGEPDKCRWGLLVMTMT